MTIFKKMHYLCHTYEGMHSRVRRDIKSLMKSRIPFPADDRSYLVKLIAQGEHQQQDFKYKVMDAVKLARSVSAFANTDGGRLLIGVRDDGHLSGVRSEEEIFMMHAAAFKYCRPQAAIKFETFHAEGKTIVIATVPPTIRRPVCALSEEGKSIAYIRIADENIVASPIHLKLWQMDAAEKGQSMTFGEQEHTLLNTLGDHPDITLNRLVRLSRLPRHVVVSILARLVRFGLVGMKHTNQQFLFYEL